jgi:hypothetical protein
MDIRQKKEKVVVVVDAFSTGQYLPEEILKHGLNWVHIHSRETLPSFLTSKVKHTSCLLEIYFNGELDQLIFQLDKYDIVAVMAGTETSIELTDCLAERLGLPGNNPTTSHLRRNKYYMIEAVRKAGLNAADQIIASSI